MTDLHTERVEASVFGALLFSAEPQPEILAALSPGDFATPWMGPLWRWCQEQRDGITPMGLAQHAASAGAPFNLTMILSWADHLEWFALWREQCAEVQRLRAVRDVAKVAADIIAEATDPAACPGTIADHNAARLVDIARGSRGGGMRTVAEVMPEVLAYMEAKRASTEGEAIATGFAELDRVSPLRPGELTILAARPSVGKSALAVNIATNMTMGGIPAGLVSLEMTAGGLVRRVLQSEAGVSLNAVHPRSPLGEYNALLNAARSLTGLQLVICQPGRLTVSGLRRVARQMVGQYQIRALFVDYLQLVLPDQRSSNRNRENEVSEVSAAAKAIAVDCAMPVVMLAQLNRQAEDDKPRLSHLRDSGSIEQDADVVWLMDRNRNDASGLTCVTVAKNRDGECGVKVPLVFDAGTTRFRDGGGAKYTQSRGAAVAEATDTGEQA